MESPVMASQREAAFVAAFCGREDGRYVAAFAGWCELERARLAVFQTAGCSPNEARYLFSIAGEGDN
jgi:hypothetical protein